MIFLTYLQQWITAYEANAEERALMKAVLQGFADIGGGRTVSLADAMKRLGLD